MPLPPSEFSQGVVSQGDTIELPALGLQRGVRSIQAFKRPVTRAVRGDRVGVCVAQLDAKVRRAEAGSRRMREEVGKGRRRGWKGGK